MLDAVSNKLMLFAMPNRLGELGCCLVSAIVILAHAHAREMTEVERYDGTMERWNGQMPVDGQTTEKAGRRKPDDTRCLLDLGIPTVVVAVSSR